METLRMPIFPPPRDPAMPLAPPADLHKLLCEPHLSRVRQWDGVDAWLVTRFDDARTALNSRALSVDPRKPGYPEKSAAYKEVLGKDRNLRTMDGAEHIEQKRMLARDLTVPRVNEMRPAIQAKVDGLIDAMLAGGRQADLVTDLALPVPTMVICELLGVPYADRDWYAEKSQICISSRVPAEAAAAAAQELYEYLEGLIAEKDRAPENDLLSRLAVDQLRPGIISVKDVIELSRFLLIAGHETTANMISLSVLTLLQHPDQRELVAQGLDHKVLANAVDEMLRFLSIVHSGRRRVAIEDLEIGGQIIRAGEGVIILNNVADRDEAMFPNPGALDLLRPNARAHLAFGGGAHRCLGAFLSQVELEIVHGTLWRRIPTLELDTEPGRITYNEEGAVFGLTSLPVRW